MKRTITALLALSICLCLAACGDKRDVSGIGTVTLEEKAEDDVGTLGGSEDAPESTDGPAPTAAPAQELATQTYDDAKVSMTIPSGWTVQSAVDGNGMLMVKAYDPQNTSLCIMYYGLCQPLFPSDESRQIWSGQSDSRYSYAPVISAPTAEQMLLCWNDCAAEMYFWESPVSFPEVNSVSILSANTYEGDYAQYGATESEAVASCVSSDGTACGAYLCTAMLLTDPQAVAGKDTSYYSAYHNYLIMAPQDTWDVYCDTLQTCLASITPKSAGSSGVAAPKGSVESFHTPEFKSDISLD